MSDEGRMTRAIRRGEVSPVKVEAKRKPLYMHSYARRKLGLKRIQPEDLDRDHLLPRARRKK